MVDKDLTLIERYYNFLLSDSELKDFESRMEQDAVLTQKVLDYHLAHKTAREFYNSAEERERVMAWEKLLQGDKSKKNYAKRTYLGWAAGILLLVGLWATSFWLKEDKPQNWSDLLVKAKTMTPDLNYRLLRGENPVLEEEILKDGYALLLSENYRKAIVLFSVVTVDDPYYEDALLLSAISHYELKEYQASLLTLSKMKATANTEQQIYLWWYESLNYLELRDVQKVRSALNQLKKQDGKIKEKADQLIQLIDQVEAER